MQNSIYQTDEEQDAITLADLRKQEQNDLDKVDLGEAVERLYKNKDFERIILEMYFKSEPTSLVRQIASDSFSEKGKEQSMKELMSIGMLQNYLNELISQGLRAKETLGETREVISEHISH